MEWFDKALEISPSYSKAKCAVTTKLCVRAECFVMLVLRRSWKRKVEGELRMAAMLGTGNGDARTGLLFEPMDESGKKFQVKFGGGTIVL